VVDALLVLSIKVVTFLDIFSLEAVALGVLSIKAVVF
jgi:hypothetical protein